MSTTVIASKTEQVKFGFWPVKEEITTTLQLVHLGNGNFSIDYFSRYSGIKTGNTKGGPVVISENTQVLMNDSPKVKVRVKNYNVIGHKVSLHIVIDLDIPLVGTKTIYNQTLEGTFEATAGWQLWLSRLQSSAEDPESIIAAAS